jgi:hypothetical protein
MPLTLRQLHQRCLDIADHKRFLTHQIAALERFPIVNGTGLKRKLLGYLERDLRAAVLEYDAARTKHKQQTAE